MSLTPDDVKKIAHLARLNLTAEDVSQYTTQLSNILDFVAQMNAADTDNIAPLVHAHELAQRLRPDVVTETNQRSAFQAIAPEVEAGLYLVPQVIEAG